MIIISMIINTKTKRKKHCSNFSIPPCSNHTLNINIITNNIYAKKTNNINIFYPPIYEIYEALGLNILIIKNLILINKIFNKSFSTHFKKKKEKKNFINGCICETYIKLEK